MLREHRSVAAIFLFVLLLRLPFLNQAIQGDDYYYLAGAEHALIDPLHPTHVRYAFQGRMVDMRGHPHPPFNAWWLGGLLAIAGDIKEIPFHAAYIVFSMIAGFAALSLARRFCPHPLLATLLFLATPAFVINGNSLEADVPFVAFWLLAIACFVTAVDKRSTRWLLISVVASAMAAFAAYQAVVLVPILGLFLWLNGRQWKPAWIVIFTAPAVLIAWNIFERLSGGSLPASMLAGYMQADHLQSLVNKVRNAVALTVHLGWILFPALTVAAFWRIPRWSWAVVGIAAVAFSFVDPNPLMWATGAVGVVVLLHCLNRLREDTFLAGWVLIFFAASLVLFFAGSARYLLPIALPLAILAARRCKTGWLSAGIVLQLALSLTLTIINYQHWNAYRDFAKSLPNSNHRIWVNGEWGLRYYLEAAGALPLLDDGVSPGDIVISSSLSQDNLSIRKMPAALLTTRIVTSPIPLRLITPHGPSAYSVDAWGFRPFDITTAPIDQITVLQIADSHPALSYLPMNAPEAAKQIISGIYDLEPGGWRWMSGRGTILLKIPDTPSRIVVDFTIPDMAPGRTVRLSAAGILLAVKTYDKPGAYTLTSDKSASASTVNIEVDKTFAAPPDKRELGIILQAAGYR